MSGPHGGLREIGGSHAVCNTFVVRVLLHAWPFPTSAGLQLWGHCSGRHGIKSGVCSKLRPHVAFENRALLYTGLPYIDIGLRFRNPSTEENVGDLPPHFTPLVHPNPSTFHQPHHNTFTLVCAM